MAMILKPNLTSDSENVNIGEYWCNWCKPLFTKGNNKRIMLQKLMTQEATYGLKGC